MLELFGWNVGMTTFAALLLVVGALLISAVPQFIGETTFGFEWIVAAAAVLVGGWIGSEALGAASTWGFAFEGLYVLPALIGGVILGVAVDAITRYTTGGSYTHAPRGI